MELTLRQLNRSTLNRQLLLARQRLSSVDAVRSVMALQAQEAASPYVALWNRIAGFDPVDLDEAFAGGQIVKAPLMRVTLHAVVADEYTTLHRAMLDTLRAARLNDRRFETTGLSIDDADALIPHLVDFASEVRSKEEIEDLLLRHLDEPPHRHVWWALRTFAPLVHAPTGGPWSFGQRPSYMAAPTAPAGCVAIDDTQRLIWRYLEAFGPATARDIGQFAMLRQREIRPVVEATTDELVAHVGPDGEVLYDVPDGLIPAGTTAAPSRLLGMWDSALLAYADRSRIIPEEYRRSVIRTNGDVLPTLLVDGYVAGVWRHVDNHIEALAFSPLADDVWDDLEAEAGSLLRLLAGRDDRLYGRYWRWWEKLPDGEKRILGPGSLLPDR